MRAVDRVSATLAEEELDVIIREHEESGTPLVVEDWQKLPSWQGKDLFSLEWLQNKFGEESEFVCASGSERAEDRQHTFFSCGYEELFDSRG
jgi:hypothetical protein